MGRVDDHRATLRTLPEPEWADWLIANSGLPGPRGNLELLSAVVEEAPAELLRCFASSDHEYLAACGAAGMGRLLAEGLEEVEPIMRALATDARWRVREGVAMGLQRFGDADPDGLFALASDWVTDRSWLVKRAAVAGVCEPRLLRRRGEGESALQVVDSASKALLHAAQGERRSPELRVLRQALGYCWSVAVAALPDEGFPLFAEWASVDDPDVRWMVRENLKKKRLQRADSDAYRQISSRFS